MNHKSEEVNEEFSLPPNSSVAIVYGQHAVCPDCISTASGVCVHLLLATGVLGSFQLPLVEAFYVADLLLLSLDLLLELILLHLRCSSLRRSTSHLAFQLIQLGLYHTHTPRQKGLQLVQVIYYFSLGHSCVPY